MNKLKKLSKEQRQAARIRAAELNHVAFLTALMPFARTHRGGSSTTAENRAKVADMSFEGYRAEWLGWWTVAELEAEFEVPGHRIRRAIRLGVFERYSSHDDKLLRVRLGDFVEWYRGGCKTEREAA